MVSTWCRAGPLCILKPFKVIAFEKPAKRTNDYCKDEGRDGNYYSELHRMVQLDFDSIGPEMDVGMLILVDVFARTAACDPNCKKM